MAAGAAVDAAAATEAEEGRVYAAEAVWAWVALPLGRTRSQTRAWRRQPWCLHPANDAGAGESACLSSGVFGEPMSSSAAVVSVHSSLEAEGARLAL